MGLIFGKHGHIMPGSLGCFFFFFFGQARAWNCQDSGGKNIILLKWTNPYSILIHIIHTNAMIQVICTQRLLLFDRDRRRWPSWGAKMFDQPVIVFVDAMGRTSVFCCIYRRWFLVLLLHNHTQHISVIDKIAVLCCGYCLKPRCHFPGQDLLNLGADLAKSDCKGNTPLHAWSSEHFIQALRSLREKSPGSLMRVTH